ncbi:MAG: glycolate oxidase subunit GlcE [Alphaproteobacteria bacterium]
MEVLRPADARQVEELVAWAAAGETPLEVLGGGSKRALGRPVAAEHAVDLSGLTGISLYEPEELVLSAAVGTTLAEIERTLAAHAQVLAFEPPDLGPLLGAEAGSGTIGGAVACNLAGPRRIKAGAARDHFLGVEAVSGRGEAFKAGGRVIKNVTGYDMCKLLAGAYGTLAAMTRVTLKVLPAPETTRTVLLLGLDPVEATAAMTAALGSSHEVSGAAHLPASLAARLAEAAGAGKSLTAIRVEGIAPSVEARTTALRQELSDYGRSEELDDAGSRALWARIRDAAPLADPPDRVLWRLSVAPQAGHSVAAALADGHDVEALYDWGGGLVWLALDGGDDAGAEAVRKALERRGGHATLVRAPAEVRAAVPVFQPQPEPLAELTRRVKEAFDPNRILNRGRMYAEV